MVYIFVEHFCRRFSKVECGAKVIGFVKLFGQGRRISPIPIFSIKPFVLSQYASRSRQSELDLHQTLLNGIRYASTNEKTVMVLFALTSRPVTQPRLHILTSNHLVINKVRVVE